MQVTVEVQRTREYFAEAFAEAIRFTRWRRWTPVGVVVLLVFGAFFLAWAPPQYWYFGAFFLGAAVYEAFKIWYTRRVWLRDRMAGPAAGQTATLVFSDDGIQSNGPHSEGTLTWQGIHEARVSDRGLNLQLEKGIGIYLPRSLFGSEADLEAIVAKCKVVRRR